MKANRRTDGYALILALSLMVLLGILTVSYSLVTRSELVSSKNTANSTTGFYAAEAALNARAETFRAKFKGYQVPSGVSPTSNQPCTGSNVGSGDFACQTVNINNRVVTSYVVKLNTQNIQIGAGEQYANLTAEETQYVVYGQSLNNAGNPEAITQLVFRSRLVPLFQFAIFFGKDLEFDNTANLDLAGPVHANGNIFLDAGSNATLDISGQVSASGTLYRGQKSANVCYGQVNVDDLSANAQTVNCSGNRRAMTATELPTWGGQLAQNVPAVTIPDVSSLQPQSGSLYWSQADVRVVLKPGSGSAWNAELQDVNGNTTVTSALLAATCPAALTTSNTFLDNREAKYWDGLNAARDYKRLLDVNMQLLTSCVNTNSTLLGVLGYTNTSSDKGLVFYFTVKDNSISQGTAANNYGVRLFNGANLHATLGSVPKPSRVDKGLTVVSDQAMIVQGSYNTSNKVPAALLADSMNVLSNNWNTATPCGTNLGYPYYWGPGVGGNGLTYNAAQAATGDAKSGGPMGCRTASATTINAAVLAGTDTSGFSNAQNATEGNLDGGTGSGGVHNMMRFQEDWGSNSPTALSSPAVYTYLGSLVSIGRPLHARGTFAVGGAVYQPPKRNWSFDSDFRDASKLPPLSPRFVYIKQDNFVRNFTQ